MAGMELITAEELASLRNDNARLRSELLAVAGMLAEASATPDKGKREKLLRMAEARARDGGGEGEMEAKGS